MRRTAMANWTVSIHYATNTTDETLVVEDATIEEATEQAQVHAEAVFAYDYTVTKQED
jgi:hypothetical protein